MAQVPYAELQRIVDRFLDEVAQVPGRAEPADPTCGSTRRKLRVDINRDKLGDVGVHVDTVGRTLRDDARRPPGHALQARRRAVRRDRAGRAARPQPTPADISDIYVRGARRQRWCSWPTSSTCTEGVAPQSLNHFNRLRAVKITGTLAPGYTIGEALKAMDDAAKRVLPADGADRPRRPVARVPRVAAARSTSTFVLALIFIYLVLSAQFESFVDPFVIMLSVPLSMTGALFALWLTGGTLNIYSQVGLDHAGRADHQARHPDRRVREPAAGNGREADSTRSSMRRRCGCGRS